MGEQEKPPGGVDPTLIEWMLSLTPAERLAELEAHISDLEILRNAKMIPRQSESPEKP